MRLLLSVLITLLLGGCSVFMAASGSKDPELNSIRGGVSTRAEVEKILGKPNTVRRMSYGDEVTYQYFTNDKASYLRAALYLGLDLVTGFLAELATFPVESVQGDRHVVTFVYATNGYVKDVKFETIKAPMPAPETLITK